MLSEDKQIELENMTAEVLAMIYMRVQWYKLNIRSAHTFFIDRVRASCTTKDFKTFLDVFCTKMSVDFVKIDTEVLKELNEYNSFVMYLLRSETVYIANLALAKVDEWRNRDKAQTKLM